MEWNDEWNGNSVDLEVAEVVLVRYFGMIPSIRYFGLMYGNIVVVILVVAVVVEVKLKTIVCFSPPLFTSRPPVRPASPPARASRPVSAPLRPSLFSRR